MSYKFVLNSLSLVLRPLEWRTEIGSSARVTTKRPCRSKLLVRFVRWKGKFQVIRFVGLHF